MDVNENSNPVLTVDKATTNWFYAGANQTTYIKGAGDRNYSLTLNNTIAGTDSFLKAEGAGAKIEVSNLDNFVFQTDSEFSSVSNNNNPLITSSGGSITFDNINHVQFGTADKPLQVDQVSHQNWNGGDVAFRNIDKVDVYANKTAFLIQSQDNNFAALRFENVGEVNISGGARRIGIQIGATCPTADTVKTFEVLNVSKVGAFNVSGGSAAIYISNTAGQYQGRGNALASIQADEIALTGGTSGLTAYLSNSPSSTIAFTILASRRFTSAGDLYGLQANNDGGAVSGMQISIAAPEVVLSANDKDHGNALFQQNSAVNIQSNKVSLDGNVELRGADTSLLLKGAAVEASTVSIAGNVKAASGTTFAVSNSSLSFAGDSFSTDGTVEINDGVLEMKGSSTAKIYQLSGRNARTVLHRLSQDGEAPVLEVGSNAVHAYEIALASEVNDTFAGDAQKAAQALQKSISVTDQKGTTGTHTMMGESGKLSDGWVAEVNADGDVVVTETTTNEALDVLSNFTAMTLVQWRNEANHINQRLGDVRDSSSTVGAWARVYGYDSSYSDNVSIDYKANSIQVGGDYRINDTWLVGGAFSYTDGEGKFSNGSSESDGYTLAAYLSGFFPCGGYVDLVGRIGRLSTDITAGSQGSVFKGDYANTTFGLSAEVGYHWKFNDIFYVEPQAELAYGFVKGDDFTGANRVKISQDDFQTLVGRLGARVGASFADGDGTVYAHASVNHDFLGDADYSASYGDVTRNFGVDIGGTWVSYGVGAQFNTTANLNFYGTLERSNGSEYQEDYRYSVGMRYRF